MSAVGKDAGGSNQDFDLNIAPIIDCFTVLITYLLVSASFLTLNILDIGVAANGESPPPEVNTVIPDPPVMFALEIAAGGVITLKISGGPKHLEQSFPIAGGPGGAWDVSSALAKVSQSMTLYPKVQEISVTADPTVRYKDIIKVLDPMKKVMPKVYLAGK